MKRIAAVAAVTLSAACAAFPAQAQQYPTKPIRVVVPYAAGGTSDILARQIGPMVTDAWGQPVIVENKPGANGNVGAEFVARSSPDGYTLLLTDLGGLVISASVYPKLPFDPAKDFSPVVMVSYSPHVLAVHPSVQAKDVKELVAMAKAHPGKLNFAISGIGGAPHLAGIEFAQRTGVDWTYIPYKGGVGRRDRGGRRPGPRPLQRHARDLALGHRRQAQGARHLQRGARSSAASTPDRRGTRPARLRDRLLPRLVGPAGTPREVVAKLNAELTRMLNTPEMKARFAEQGTDVRTGTPESLGNWMRTEQARWAKVVKESGAKFE